MKLKTFESLTLYTSRYRIGYALLIGVGLFLMLFKLGTLTPGLNAREVATAQTSSISQIVHQPINAPYRLLQAASLKVLGRNAIAVRLPSVIFAVAAIFGVYLFLRCLYGERIALMGAILMGLSSYMLGFARLGTPDIAIIWSLGALLGIGAWFESNETITWWMTINALIVVILVAYTPFGWVWLLLIAVAHPRELWFTARDTKNSALISSVAVFVLALAPLAYSLIMHPGNLKQLVLWPEQFAGIRWVAGGAFRAVLAPFWRDTVLDPATHLGNLPLLDIFGSALALLGGLTLFMKATLARSRILAVILAVGVVSIALTRSPGAFALLLVPLAILEAIGLNRLLFEWYDMFPRNPFARIGALFPLTLVIGLSCYYQIHRSFIAWPRTPETKAAFQSKLE